MHFRLLLISLSLTFSSAFSQQLNLPLQKDIVNLYGRHLNKKNVLFHTSVQPYLKSEVDQIVTFDSVWSFNIPVRDANAPFIKRLGHSIVYDDILPIRKDGFYLAINPLIDFSFGNDFQDNKITYRNTRAIGVKGNFGNKVSIESRFFENQAKFPAYLDEIIRGDTAVPGQGRPRNFKSGGYDFAWADGYLNYAPSRHFNLQIGHGKHFLGDGYRSLFLSDNAFNYPYLKLTAQIWRLKYMVLYAQMLDINFEQRNFVGGFPKKYATVHYLSWDIKNRFQFGLFESIIWQDGDSLQKRGFELQYLNPVIFLRPVEFSLGSPDNASIGFFTNFKVSDHVFIYQQLMIDDLDFKKSKDGGGFYRNKVGFQLGMKVFDLFDVEHLFVQTEYNVVRPYTYAHKVPIQNHAHYNQPIAHPLGANFHELIGMVNYRYKRLFGAVKVVYANVGLDSTGQHKGQNIFVSDFNIPGYPNSYGNNVGQGINTNILNAEIAAQFIINPKINLNFEVKLSQRLLSNEFQDDKTTWLTFSLKSSLNNYYYDY